MALHRAVAVHQQYVHGSFLSFCVFIVLRTDDQIGDAVAIQVTQAGQRTAELVIVIQSAGREAGQTVADLDVALHCAVAVHQQHVHCPFKVIQVFVLKCSDGQIPHAVPVQVTQAGQRTAEAVIHV